MPSSRAWGTVARSWAALRHVLQIPLPPTLPIRGIATLTTRLKVKLASQNERKRRGKDSE
jgi:hypothetical protein